ncbi:hypothetical protein [Candidatus Bodocaedibacter vickermanii]|jgi:hypothetical protein|uniref:Uncharacterized protein n=1 Tax=Candidatus Bodocaedibacter vickermanii TaxID=2741701 RepID=A0A7L9RUW1_9PROT|nr:hypothetical protein CPBP_01214 [Candidatus Paracaedibacteraceae bacterium 'Lake Konstanz']
MRKIAYKQESAVYNFPGLMEPKRERAVNDNRIPMLGMIFKHAALMSFALGAFYVIQLLV